MPQPILPYTTRAQFIIKRLQRIEQVRTGPMYKGASYPMQTPSARPFEPQIEEASATQVLSNIDAMVGYWGRDLRCRFANPAYQQWFGVSPKDLVGEPIQNLLGPLFDLNIDYIRGALKGIPQNFERAIAMADGSIRHSIAHYQPEILGGVVQGFTAHVTDVTKMKLLQMELESARKEMERLATHDYLTGLPNRVHLNDRLKNALCRAKESGELAGVIAIDFDGFKLMNDRYGHDTGDFVLRSAARRMTHVLKGEDSVTRIGGDEFMYLATGLKAWDGVHSVIHRLGMVLGLPIVRPGVSIHLKFSCGVAVFPWHGRSPAMLREKADRALYEAKDKGGSTTVFAREL